MLKRDVSNVQQKTQSADRNKQVECNVSLRKMRLDTVFPLISAGPQISAAPQR